MTKKSSTKAASAAAAGNSFDDGHYGGPGSDHMHDSASAADGSSADADAGNAEAHSSNKKASRKNKRKVSKEPVAPSTDANADAGVAADAAVFVAADNDGDANADNGADASPTRAKGKRKTTKKGKNAAADAPASTADDNNNNNNDTQNSNSTNIANNNTATDANAEVTETRKKGKKSTNKGQDTSSRNSVNNANTGDNAVSAPEPASASASASSSVSLSANVGPNGAVKVGVSGSVHVPAPPLSPAPAGAAANKSPAPHHRGRIRAPTALPASLFADASNNSSSSSSNNNNNNGDDSKTAAADSVPAPADAEVNTSANGKTQSPRISPRRYRTSADIARLNALVAHTDDSPRKAEEAAAVRARAKKFDTVTRAISTLSKDGAAEGGDGDDHGPSGRPSRSPSRNRGHAAPGAALSPAGATLSVGAAVDEEAVATARDLARRMAQVRLDAETHRRETEAAEAARLRALEDDMRRSSEDSRAMQEQRLRDAQEEKIRASHQRLAAVQEQRDREAHLRAAAAQWVSEKNAEIPRYMQMEQRRRAQEEQEEEQKRRELEARREEQLRNKFDPVAVAEHERNALDALRRRELELQRKRIEAREMEIYGIVRTRFDADNNPIPVAGTHNGPNSNNSGFVGTRTVDGDDHNINGDNGEGDDGSGRNTFITETSHQDMHGEGNSQPQQPQRPRVPASTKWRPSQVPQSNSLIAVRTEQRIKAVELETANERKREPSLRAREYSLQVPVPAPDLTKAQQAEQARLREARKREEIAAKQNEGAQQRRAMQRDVSLAGKLVTEGAKHMTKAEVELIKRNRAAHEKAIRDQTERKKPPVDYLKLQHQQQQNSGPRQESPRRVRARENARPLYDAREKANAEAARLLAEAGAMEEAARSKDAEAARVAKQNKGSKLPITTSQWKTTGKPPLRLPNGNASAPASANANANSKPAASGSAGPSGSQAQYPVDHVLELVRLSSKLRMESIAQKLQALESQLAAHEQEKACRKVLQNGDVEYEQFVEAIVNPESQQQQQNKARRGRGRGQSKPRGAAGESKVRRDSAAADTGAVASAADADADAGADEDGAVEAKSRALRKDFDADTKIHTKTGDDDDEVDDEIAASAANSPKTEIGRLASKSKSDSSRDIAENVPEQDADANADADFVASIDDEAAY